MRVQLKIKSKHCTTRAEVSRDLRFLDPVLRFLWTQNEVLAKIKSKTCTNQWDLKIGGPAPIQ